jgi:cell division initiation protein
MYPASRPRQEDRMGFTPIDVENQSFEVKMRGYDREQVKTFLSAMAEELTRLIGEKDYLDEEVTILKRKIEDSNARDRKLQETILALRDLTEKMKEDARREGELVVREARQKADTILQEARAEALRIETHIAQMRLEKETFEDRLRMLLEEHQRLLNQRRQEGSALGSMPLLGKRTREAEQ